MESVTISETRTNNFLGTCQDCDRPVRVETDQADGRTIRQDCPECGKRMTLTRLVARTTMDLCDGRCMGATGPSCSCSCGGQNHGRSFGPIATRLEFEKAITRHRAASAKRREAAAKRAETKLDKALRLYAEWLTSLAQEDQEMVAWLLEWDNVADNGFLIDMRLYVLSASKGTSKYPGQPLTERQFAAVRRTYIRTLNFAARKAEEAANAKPVPTGKAITVEGDIVMMRYDDNAFGGGGTWKMIVKGDGWKVWATVPRSLTLPRYGMEELRDWEASMKGARVRFVADVELSERDPDPSFGFAKRPRQAKLIETA